MRWGRRARAEGEERGPDGWEEDTTRPRKSPAGDAESHLAEQVMRDDLGRIEPPLRPSCRYLVLAVPIVWRGGRLLRLARWRAGSFVPAFREPFSEGSAGEYREERISLKNCSCVFHSLSSLNGKSRLRPAPLRSASLWFARSSGMGRRIVTRGRFLIAMGGSVSSITIT
jgi:hypothetical protein